VVNLFKKRRRAAPVVVSVAFCLLAAGLLLIIDLTLRSAFYNIAEIRAIQIATEAIHRTLQQEVTGGNIQYQDFVFIHKDNQGHITLMQANTVMVNRVAAKITLSVQKTLEELRLQDFEIPLGEILDIPLLANYGPRINYRIMPMGTVRVNVVDQFEAAGINQTRHKIYLNFDTNVRIVIPSKSGEAVVAAQMPLAENIIVGSVPDTFVNIAGGILGGSLIK
jgi:sporulation protein YunB